MKETQSPKDALAGQATQATQRSGGGDLSGRAAAGGQITVADELYDFKRPLFRRFSFWMTVLGVLVVLALVVFGRQMIFRNKNASNGVSGSITTVTRTNVSMVVSGAGSLVPVTTTNVSFRVGGQLTAVNVKVGDVVTQGETLASIDPTNLQTALAQANQNVKIAQDGAQTASQPLTGSQLTQMQDNLATAQTSYNDTVNAVNVTNQQDANQLNTDQSQLNTDTNQLNADTNQQNADQKQQTNDQNQLASDQKALAVNAQYLHDQMQLSADQAALAADLALFKTGCSGPGTVTNTNCSTLAQNVQTAQLKVNGDQAAVQQDQSKVTADQAAAQKDAGTVAGDQAKVAGDQAKVSLDQSKVSGDQAKQQADQTSNQSRLDQAKAAVTQAQDALSAQSQSKPGTVDSAQSQVLTAQAAAQTAQQNVGYANLIAPVSGVVTVVNSQVGDTVNAGPGSSTSTSTSGASSGTSGSSAGGASSLGAASSSLGGSSSSTTLGTSSSASGAFIVISSIGNFQVTVPFAEADAMKLKVNQPVDITFPALPLLIVKGHVSAISPSPTVSSGVVDYSVTMNLDQTDPRLKSGVTADVDVTIAQHDNVLAVPNSALLTQGSTEVVMLYKNNVQTPTAVQTGLAGDSITEIMGGLQEGDQIVLPKLTLPSSSGGGLFGGGGGSGGGGLRGGSSGGGG